MSALSSRSRSAESSKIFTFDGCEPPCQQCQHFWSRPPPSVTLSACPHLLLFLPLLGHVSRDAGSVMFAQPVLVFQCSTIFAQSQPCDLALFPESPVPRWRCAASETPVDQPKAHPALLWADNQDSTDRQHVLRCSETTKHGSTTLPARSRGQTARNCAVPKDTPGSPRNNTSRPTVLAYCLRSQTQKHAHVWRTCLDPPLVYGDEHA